MLGELAQTFGTDDDALTLHDWLLMESTCCWKWIFCFRNSKIVWKLV